MPPQEQIDSILQGRDLIHWHDLGACLKIARGAGLTYQAAPG